MKTCTDEQIKVEMDAIYGSLAPVFNTIIGRQIGSNVPVHAVIGKSAPDDIIKKDMVT